MKKKQAQVQRNYSAENTLCRPINEKALLVGLPTEDKESTDLKWRFHQPLALVTEPRICLVSYEFIGYLPEKDGKWRINIFCEGTDRKGGVSWMGILPTKMVTVNREDLEKVAGEPVTVAEFAKDRRGYNSRILGNESLLFGWLNS
jgi:hypothetical protein